MHFLGDITLTGFAQPGDEELAAGFEEYMGAVYPERPLLLYHARVLDVSEATVAKRKTRFWGHVSGYDPALVWHLRKFISEATKPSDKP